MYPQIFSAAREVDQAFLIILGFSVLILVLVTVCMLWFLWRYNYRRNPQAADIRGSVWAEVIWTVLPTLIVLGLFWTGWTSFKAMRTIPEGAMEVLVEARMWSWKFTYENGKTSPELFIPLDRPVKLALSSRDVIHSFYVPAMRVKWDMVPGMDTDAWIQSDTLGTYDIFCSEYCGLRHANMITTLTVLPSDEFNAWLNAKPGDEGKPRGLAVMEEFGCFDCHAMDGTGDVAPPLNDMAGKERMLILPGGTKRTLSADAEYLKRSIAHPEAEIVDGFGDDMPSYQGDMPEADMDAVVNYLLGRDETGAPLAAQVHPGQRLAEEEGCLMCHAVKGPAMEDAPTLDGLFGSAVKGRVNGEEQAGVADEAYLRASITDPSAWVADGYDDVMPAYDDLDEETLAGLVSFIKSLGGKP
jgi:cytochrome c oxidase subunit 2